MINSIVFECAPSYLYKPYRHVEPEIDAVKRKVEPTKATNTSKRFNKNAAIKAKFDLGIDYCI